MEAVHVGDVLLGKYEVTRVLGQGGMGLVVEARRLDLGDLVALKFLLPALRDEPELCARFDREARTATRIKNEHVVRILAVDSVDGVPFMVMEHLSGGDLSAIVRQRGALPVGESVDLLLQACEALQEAHALGIVHRDLKPGNLFVTTGPDGAPFVKVLDFGISKTTADVESSATARQVLVGTPLYMSPEQLTSARNVDARSDVWSLGVILYELLTGTTPFTGDSFPTICAAILSGHYEDIADRRPDVPEAIEQVVAEALVGERSGRLPTVDAFAARIAPFATEIGQASYARIERVARHQLASRGVPGASDGPDAPRSAADTPTVAPKGSATTAGFTRSQAASDRPVGWRRRVVVLGVGLAAGVSGLLVVRAWRSPATVNRTTAASAGAKGNTPDLPAACASGATATCEAACSAKEPGSCLALARALENGVGTPKDPARAASLYQTACDEGSLAACNGLGALYGRGDGVARDDMRAVSLYTRACDGGYALGCVNLGAMHFDGDGVPKNEPLGARFFRRGCELGDLRGCLNVGIAYAEGRGVPKDGAQAVAFGDRACTGGVPAGCVLLALAKVKGEGAPKDVSAGLDQLDALCTQGEPAGCETLARLYAKGLGTDLVADPLRERGYRKKACDLGLQRSCDADKLLDTVDSTENAAARGNALFQKSCELGDLSACDFLGENLLVGVGASVDRVRGRALLEKACKGGVERACGKLAEAGAR